MAKNITKMLTSRPESLVTPIFVNKLEGSIVELRVQVDTEHPSWKEELTNTLWSLRVGGKPN